MNRRDLYDDQWNNITRQCEPHHNPGRSIGPLYVRRRRNVLRDMPRRSPHGRRRIITSLRIARLHRRRLALAFIEIERRIQLILFFYSSLSRALCSNGMPSSSW